MSKKKVDLTKHFDEFEVDLKSDWHRVKTELLTKGKMKFIDTKVIVYVTSV